MISTLSPRGKQLAAKEPRFTCRLCRKRTPASKGCDDMFPHLCDDCWARVSMAPEAMEMRSRESKEAAA